MFPYTFTLDGIKQFSLGELQTLILAAGLPVEYINGDPDNNQIQVVFSRELTSPEQAVVAGLVSTYDGRPRRKRKPYDIYTQIGALTATQKLNISNDLFGGSPPKFTQDIGDDSPDLLVLWTLQQTGGLSTADKNLVKQAAATIYCRDNPKYLVNPSFDTSINIPGDELIP